MLAILYSLGPPDAPMLVKVDSVTAVSANLTWRPGLNRGHRQSFSVLLRPAGSSSFLTSHPGNDIPDPGQGQIVRHTVTGLKPMTRYQFQVIAENRKGSQHAELVDALTYGKLRFILR